MYPNYPREKKLRLINQVSVYMSRDITESVAFKISQVCQSGLIQKKRNLTRHLNRDDLMQGIWLYRKWRPARAKGALRIQRVPLVSSYHPWGLRTKQVGVPGTQKCGEGHPRAQLTRERQQLGTGTNFCYQEGKRAAAENRKSKGRDEVLSPTSRHASEALQPLPQTMKGRAGTSVMVCPVSRGSGY